MSEPFFLIKKSTQTQLPSGRRRTYRLSESEGKPLAAAITMFRRHLLLNDAIARSKEEAPYTWVLKDSGVLAAGHARSQQELGTLHKNLDELSGPGEVIAAGEYKKRGSALLFNLQSGTYMKKLLAKERKHEKKIEIRNGIIGTAANAFRTYMFGGDEAPIISFNYCLDECTKEQELGGNTILGTNIVTTLSNIAEYDAYLSHNSQNGSGRPRHVRSLRKTKRR